MDKDIHRGDGQDKAQNMKIAGPYDLARGEDYLVLKYLEQSKK